MTLPLTRLVSIRKNVRHRVPLQGSCDSTGARPTFCAPSWPGSESLAPFQYVWPGKHASTLVQSCWTPVTATYGSIDTGKVVAGLVSIAWSGSRSSSPGLTRTPTGARLAPDASHMLAAGAPNTSWSTPSTAVSPPAAVARSDTPVVASASRTTRRAGFSAASARFTISRSENPSGCAVSCRSTPGRTSAYVAVAPLSTGTGSPPPGQPSVTRSPSLAMLASGPLPPPENTTSTALDTGATVPSGLCRSVASTGAQVPSARRTREGVTVSCSVIVPDGLAKVWENSVRSESASTRCPCALATALADGTSGATNVQAVVGACARGSAMGAVSVAATTRPTRRIQAGIGRREGRPSPFWSGSERTTAGL